MKNIVYKKTYKPFIIWILFFMIGMISIPIVLKNLLNISGNMITKITMLLFIISINVLMYIIYKGEYVYWINGGPSFEDALNSPPIRRKLYALSHLKIFAFFGVISLVYLMFSFMFNFHIALDIILVSLSIVIGAFLTMKIKF